MERSHSPARSTCASRSLSPGRRAGRAARSRCRRCRPRPSGRTSFRPASWCRTRYSDAAPDGRVRRGRRRMRAQRLQHAPGDVRAGGVEHGVVVGEGHVAQELPVVVHVEGRPAAVARLHGEQPVDGALPAGLLRRRVRGARVPQRQQHHGGVVDVRVELVGDTRRPSRRARRSGRFTDQSPLRRTSLRQQPIGRAAAAPPRAPCPLRRARRRRWPCPKPARSRAGRRSARRRPPCRPLNCAQRPPARRDGPAA